MITSKPARTFVTSVSWLVLSGMAGVFLGFNASVAEAGAAFRFVVIPDRAGGTRPGIFDSAIAKCNLLQPDFVMSVGDHINGYSEDAAVLRRQWDEVEGIVRTLTMPYHYVPGNHDIGNPTMARVWEERHGPPYYHFVRENVLFLCLNTQDGKRDSGFIGTQQCAYALAALTSNVNVRWTFVFMHQPLWRRTTSPDLAGWKPIEDALHNRRATIFAGHEHTYEQCVRDGHDYFILATAGGGSALTGPFYGLFDHIMLVSMLSNGPHYANLMLDGVAAKDVATPATHAYARQLDRQVGVTIAPLIGGTMLSGTMSTTVCLRNDSDLVQRFDGEWQRHDTLQYAPLFLRATLQPGEQRAFNIKLTASPPLPLETTACPRLAWTQRMNPPGYAEVTRRFNTAVPLDTVYACARAPHAITVDGNLADWPELPVRVSTPDRVTYPGNWSGPADCSFAFSTAYDDSFLYVAVNVTDDDLMVDRTDALWSQDSIAVCLDGRERSLRESEPPSLATEFTSYLLFYLSPGKETPMRWYQSERLPEGCRAVCVATDDGMALELAIPIAYLNERQDGSWKDFQLNVLVNDIDLNGVARMRWRPDWTGGFYPGTGTFRRQ